ncbi:hypothetical protein Vdis_0139 [Vulcanisaeta distributa DSM 14429]|uniref:Uncharacterized protein n=2 Tax=Vulcanisaeta distributa TaxID=164451 RepID=E1QSN5_VULDI|nr:hypothetical protein Vdis_0139 [Vulcanisaeta distributa DSM 14429]
MSNFLRSLISRGDQDGRSGVQPVVDSLPAPPPGPQGQPLPFPMPGQAILESVLAEIDRLSSIERAIIVTRLLNSDEPLRGVNPEDWVRLIEERVGKAYGDAFRRWLRARCGCGVGEGQ